MRVLLFSFLFLFSASISAQNLKGNWLLAYIKASPPEMVMGEDGAVLEYNEGGYDDEQSFIEPGLMLLSVLSNSKAESYYADVKEEWKVIQDGKQVRFESLEDTLYGGFNTEGMLVLKSTIDESPTDYFFAAFSPEAAAFDLVNSSWKTNGNSGFFENKTFEFRPKNELFIWENGKHEKREFYIHTLGDFMAIEFSSEILTAGFGIIYVEKHSGTKLSGISFLSLEEGALPVRSLVNFSNL
ncbi:hypothetical protein EV198_2884 [Roseivirga ehrenbergii]|uniref:Lipocalin-like domain-containing protein n=1 Tax=Roseivirga ehrenbergii (strain DSM 102268 / JCM 13514 / KCTC 12282 / NCIMB 14502 / KMM 6017) TaxID=279360 RepID=A0A150XQT4_ROSEK|nr:hypothetical protein [Roseivirga ehrenbergii]KYG81005.1 hypothetical protein MB14_14575 [Roseivirga ehrenbergii]TCL00868.1 hypothetical protein EV198_2884 [Roseivirga ehrenbergii]